MATIANDAFTEGANTALNLHMPSPAGTSWTLEAAQFQVISSIGSVQHNRNALDRAREGTSLGGDQMDVSASCLVNGSVSRFAGVCGRMSTDGFTNQYEALLNFLNATTQQVFLYKNVAGVRTQVGNSPQNVTLAQNTYATLKLEIRAGSQVVKINGSTIVTATEANSTLSGRTYAGIIMNGVGSGNAKVDNYLSESVSGTAVTPIAAADTINVRLVPWVPSPTPIFALAFDTVAVAVLYDDTATPVISFDGIVDSTTVRLTPETGTTAVVSGATPLAAADTINVRLSAEVATIVATSAQQLGVDTARVTLSESPVVVVLTQIVAADTINVRLSEIGASIRRQLTTDTVVVRQLAETATIVANTPTVPPPSAPALVWRLTSGDTARLPHLASRDLEL